MATGGDAVDHQYTNPSSNGGKQRDLDAIVSGKIHNSDTTTSKLGITGQGNTITALTERYFDAQENTPTSLPITSLHTPASAVGDTSNSPRAQDQNLTKMMVQNEIEEQQLQQYPPTPSKSSTWSHVRSTVPSDAAATTTTSTTFSPHPQLLPFVTPIHQETIITPSASTSASTSAHSSFEENRKNDTARLAVSHPGNHQMTGSSSSSGSASFPRDTANGASTQKHSEDDGLHKSTGSYDRRGHHHHQTNDSSASFTKIGTGRRSMQIFGTPPVGIIGIHKPREIIRIDRDYTSGEICQFWSGYPFELEGRVTATQHLNILNEFNNTLASAFDPYKSIFDNILAVMSLYLSTWLMSSHYDKEIAKLDRMIIEANQTLYNPAGLNLMNPKKNGYLFLEIEYY